MSTLEYRLFYRRHLPHIQPPGATLFTTSCLTGSIPSEVLQQMLMEAKQVEAALARISDPQERARQAELEQRRRFGQWDAALDAAQSGPFWLRDPRIANLVSQSLHYRDGRIYGLDAFCIMSAIMHSLKLYTARRANLLLGREGVFWQDENYDHVVRDEAEWRHIVTYVLHNPVKAGLVQQWDAWPWTYCKQTP